MRGKYCPLDSKACEVIQHHVPLTVGSSRRVSSSEDQDSRTLPLVYDRIGSRRRSGHEDDPAELSCIVAPLTYEVCQTGASIQARTPAFQNMLGTITTPKALYISVSNSFVGARILNTVGSESRCWFKVCSHSLLGKKTPSGAYAFRRSSVSSSTFCPSRGHLDIHFRRSWFETVSERLANRCRRRMLPESRCRSDWRMWTAILRSRSPASSTSSMLKVT